MADQLRYRAGGLARGLGWGLREEGLDADAEALKRASHWGQCSPKDQLTAAQELEDLSSKLKRYSRAHLAGQAVRVLEAGTAAWREARGLMQAHVHIQ